MNRYDVQQISEATKRLQGGESVESISREMGISISTLYRWRKKYGDLKSSSVHEAKSDDSKHKAKSDGSKHKLKSDGGKGRGRINPNFPKSAVLKRLLLNRS